MLPGLYRTECRRLVTFVTYFHRTNPETCIKVATPVARPKTTDRCHNSGVTFHQATCVAAFSIFILLSERPETLKVRSTSYCINLINNFSIIACGALRTRLCAPAYLLTGTQHTLRAGIIRVDRELFHQIIASVCIGRCRRTKVVIVSTRATMSADAHQRR